MNTTIYCSVNDTQAPYKQLSRLAIAQITSGKRLKKQAFTNEQLLNIQRFANRMYKKDFVIIYE